MIGKNIGITEAEKIQIMEEALAGKRAADIAAAHFLSEAVVDSILTENKIPTGPGYQPIHLGREQVLHALKIRPTIKAAARYLGVSYNLLRAHMIKYGIPAKRETKR